MNLCHTKRCFRKPLVSVLLGLLLGMTVLLIVLTMSTYYTTRMTSPLPEINGKKPFHEKRRDDKQRSLHEKTYLVLWYRMLGVLRKRRYAASANFSSCNYNNCIMTLDQRKAIKSDAVLFGDFSLENHVPFSRPPGQIWIYAEQEAPPVLEGRAHEKGNLTYYTGKGAFNWTMTYNKALADLHLPYGELRRHKSYVKKDYHKIAVNKTRGALAVVSHCPTVSRRMEFIKELKKYTDVEVLGRCGKKWSCGARFYHDDCFDILNNTYSFFLDFENSLCQQYFTEKLFENFKYDILFVVRGGKPHEASSLFPKGSIIDSDDFQNAQELGQFLSELSKDKHEYAKRLAAKSQFYSIDYRESYQRALCDLCYRLNHQDVYHQTIPDVFHILNKKQSCR